VGLLAPFQPPQRPDRANRPANNSASGSRLRREQRQGVMGVTPRSREYENVTVTYMHRAENTHIYTLSISIDKNHSTEVCGALYIPTKEYNYKVIT